jgi:diguanylate cyclase
MLMTDINEKAAEYMRLAVPLMKKHGVAMTPTNYTLWYEYVSGKNDALNRAVNESIAENTIFSEQLSNDLYAQFFDRGKDQLALHEMRVVASGLSNSDHVSSELTKCLDKFHPDLSQSEVRAIVEQVLSQTRVALSNGSELSDRLNSAVSDIEEIKRDLEQAKRESQLDTLTQLVNRKTFEQHLYKSTKDADETGADVCVILCDLDLFHNINSKHGHLVGDQVLRVVAKSLKSAVKGRDLVARHSGEQFAILLLNTSLNNVKTLAESIRLDIASKRIQRKDTRESLGDITVSLGIASYVAPEGAESFMQRVDRALYMSKRNGRNTISEAPPPFM